MAHVSWLVIALLAHLHAVLTHTETTPIARHNRNLISLLWSHHPHLPCAIRGMARGGVEGGEVQLSQSTASM